MSAREIFDEYCFSEWYMATLERALFQRQNEEEIKIWEQKVCGLFRVDSAMVALASQYLTQIGIDPHDLSEDERALVVSQNLFLELLECEIVAKERFDMAGGLTRVEPNTRVSPFVMNTGDHMLGEESESEEIPAEEQGQEPKGTNQTTRGQIRGYGEMLLDMGATVSQWKEWLNMFLDDPCEGTEKLAIQVLREMREVGKRKGSRENIESYIRTSGLAETILKIGKEWMEIGHRSKFMETSFRKYQWREALLLCLAKLTQGFVLKSVDLILEEERALLDPPGQKQKEESRISPRDLITLISERNMVPMGVKPHSIFFLCSEQNFISACFDWLLPSVNESRKMTFEAKDVTRMYRSICRLTGEAWSSWNISEDIRVILDLSRKLRQDRKTWKTEAHRKRNKNRNMNRNSEDNPSKAQCRLCAPLGESERCIQYHGVRESPLKDMLQNKLIVPENNDMLTPLTKNSRGLKEQRVLISDLNLDPIKFNQEIYDRCGQLVYHLVDDRTQEEIAGVIFNFLESSEMEKLAENQAKIKRLTTKLNRRSAMSRWNYGEMRAIGSRQPMGGRPGDGYGPYPGTSILNQEDIYTLFAYASDMELMLARVEPHAPSAVKDLKDAGQEACVLGSYGITAYHCWNYIAPQHFDKDGTWTLSYQLFKKGCLPDEFNFCLSHWGKMLETRENCIWWFKGDHLHGTLAPRASTFHKGGCLSQGIGITMPHRSLEMGRKYLQARASWKQLCDHWQVKV